jgi:hypothetical protein
VSSMPSADPYASITERRCEISFMPPYRLFYRYRQRFSYRSKDIRGSGNFTA